MYSSIVDCVRKSFDYKVTFCPPGCNTAAPFCWNCRYTGTCICRSYEYNSRSCKPSSICRKMRCTNDSNRRFVCRHTSLVVYRNNYSMLNGTRWDNFRSWGSCVCPEKLNKTINQIKSYLTRSGVYRNEVSKIQIC